jgi:excinuclease ABC subunit B
VEAAAQQGAFEPMYKKMYETQTLWGHNDASQRDVFVGFARDLGLDIPEITLVAILDADKEGFLRSETSLVQTIGRAARNVDGHVIMYADTITDSMRHAIDETNRRRKIQDAYNKEHGITPQSIKKDIRDLISLDTGESVTAKKEREKDPESMTKKELNAEIARLTKKMNKAAMELNFEEAAVLRDELKELKIALRDYDD